MRDRPTENLSDLFRNSGIDRRLFALRDANPDLAFELDEIARAVSQLREKIAGILVSATP